jgi:hypothetical protein
MPLDVLRTRASSNHATSKGHQSRKHIEKAKVQDLGLATSSLTTLSHRMLVSTFWSSPENGKLNSYQASKNRTQTLFEYREAGIRPGRRMPADGLRRTTGTRSTLWREIPRVWSHSPSHEGPRESSSILGVMYEDVVYGHHKCKLTRASADDAVHWNPSPLRSKDILPELLMLSSGPSSTASVMPMTPS